MVSEFRFDIELNGKTYNLSAKQCENNSKVAYIIGLPTYFHYKEDGVLKSVPSEHMLQLVRKPNGEYSFIPWKDEILGVGIYAIQQEVSGYLMKRQAA